MKKYAIKKAFLGKLITGSVGVIPLTEKTSQKDLIKLFKAGFTDVVEVVVEEAEDERKEEV
tara:strand:- start:1073 stop:1255 length:183 start_codon:yes stop_codon:yes gene_type:complete